MTLNNYPQNLPSIDLIAQKVNQLPTITPLVLAMGMLIVSSAQAQTDLGNQIANDQIQRQQQQDAARNQALIPTPNVKIDTPSVTPTQTSTPAAPNTPCFPINQIGYNVLDDKALKDVHQFDFALAPATHGNTSVLGKCLGVAQINQLVSDVQNRIIERGYATTRVVIANQNLSSGKLVLTLIPGYIDAIQADTTQSKVAIHTNRAGLPTAFSTALPLKAGDLLNIRNLETGLENLKRVPTADADFSITPSHTNQTPGHSDVLIKYAQSRKYRIGVGIDDSGSKATGKYQGNVTLSLDNPTNHNDLFYATYGHDLNSLGGNNKDKNSENYALGYVLPIQRWLLNATHSHYTYDQTVAGATQDYTYSGKSDTTNLGLSYLAHRDAKSKTYLTAGGFVKSQNNYIDDTEVDVQRRKIAGWTAGLNHDTSFGANQLKTQLTYQRGTGAFNALTPPESLFNEGTYRTGIYKASANFNAPFKLNLSGNKPDAHPTAFNYNATLSGQYAEDALVPSERMSIGGRYTVRGFDGERTLSGDNGVLLRQDLSMALGNTSHAAYIGIDAGHVAMKNKAQDDLLLGHNLVGGAIGFKGQVSPIATLPISYDVFTGYPISQPKGFGNKDWTSGFSLNIEF